MSEALKRYFETRGAQAELARASGISPGYLSAVASGARRGSLEMFRLIARHSPLTVAELTGEMAFEEPAVSEWQPGPAANRMRAAAETVAPGLRAPAWFRVNRPVACASLLPGDLVIAEHRFDPQAITPDALVVANVCAESGEAETVIGRYMPPWIVGGDGRTAGEIGRNASVLAVVQGVLRGSGIG